MRKRSAVFFAIVFALAPIALADLRIESTNTEPSNVAGIDHRRITLRNSINGESVTIDLALFPAKSAALRVIDNASGDENLADVMVREKCVAGVNGGYFGTDFRPIGLRIIDGAMTSPLVRAHLLTGVLCASSRGIEIVRLGEFSRKQKLDAAIECGPFLVDLGLRVRGLDDLRTARRTFVAVARGRAAALGISSDLSLAGLSEALGALPDFKIWRALNLDGGSSSAFWFRRNDGKAFSISEEKAVRDFVGISAK